MFKLFSSKNNNPSKNLKIKGMHCSSCSLNIESALEEIPKVIKVVASYTKEEVIVEYDIEIDWDKVYETIDSLGYIVLREQ